MNNKLYKGLLLASIELNKQIANFNNKINCIEEINNHPFMNFINQEGAKQKSIYYYKFINYSYQEYELKQLNKIAEKVIKQTINSLQLIQ